MQLKTIESPAVMQLTGEAADIVIEAGQRFVIETSPGGADILDAEVPADKQWIVGISIDVREVDV